MAGPIVALALGYKASTACAKICAVVWRNTSKLSGFLLVIMERVASVVIVVVRSVKVSLTLAAMAEAERLANDPNTKRYHDVDEALAELKR